MPRTYPYPSLHPSLTPLLGRFVAYLLVTVEYPRFWPVQAHTAQLAPLLCGSKYTQGSALCRPAERITVPA
jgi:hypothetical protein